MTEDEREYMRMALKLGLVTPRQWMRMHGFDVPKRPQDVDWAYQGYGPSEGQVQSWEAMRERWKDEGDR